MKTVTTFYMCLLLLTIASCKRETISNRDNLILAKWDCVDYSDTTTHQLKGHAPVFISHLYEKGYECKKSGLMWTRDTDASGKMYTRKEYECEWLLSDDYQELSLIFPENKIEKYEIVEMTRKSMTLKGIEGFWAGDENTYIFEKE